MGGRRHDKFKKMYAFLAKMEQDEDTFSLSDLADATGYKMSSIRTYYGKRLKGLLVEETDEDGVYEATGLGSFDEESFINYMTQRSSPADVVSAGGEPVVSEADADELTGEDAVIEGLIAQSAACFKLGLEFYHREHASGRVLACSGLFCDAWRILFDAETVRIRGVEQLTDSNFVTPHRGLGEVISRFFPNPRDPVRRNLEWLSHLHDAAAHLLVPETEPYLCRLLQACALNYRRRWEAVAGRRLFDRGAGMLAMGLDGAFANFEQIEERYGDHLARRITALISALHVEEGELSTEIFCADPSLHLVLTPRVHETHLELASHHTSRLADEAITPRETYPYNSAEVVHEINKRLPYTTRISSAAIEVIDAQHDVRVDPGNSLYFFDEEPPHHRYSSEYVEWVSRAILDDPDWLERVRRSFERGRRS